MLKTTHDSLYLPFQSSFGQQPTTYSLLSTRSGVPVPGWKDKIKRRANACSTYNRTEQSASVGPPGSWRVTRRYVGTDPAVAATYPRSGQASGYSGGVFANVDPTLYVPSSASAAALSGFISRARSRLTQLQTGVVGAELHKTVHGLTHPASAVLAAVKEHEQNVQKRFDATLRRLRSGKLRTARTTHDNLVRMVQSSYLEWTFGIQPTLLDVRDGARLAARLINGFVPNEIVSSRVNFSQNLDTFRSEGTIGSLNGIGTVKTLRVVSVAGTISYKGALKPSFLGSATSAAGLDLPNFLPSLWEWLPYSWLVDYFTNVSDILDGLSFATGSLQYCSKSITATAYETHTSNGVQTFPGTDVVNEVNISQESAFAIKTTKYSRVDALLESFVPPVQFQLPTGKQALNVAAVILQHQPIVKRLSGALNRVFPNSLLFGVQ